MFSLKHSISFVQIKMSINKLSFALCVSNLHLSLWSLLFIKNVVYWVLLLRAETLAVTAICWWVLTPPRQTRTQPFFWPLTPGCRGAIVVAEARSSDDPGLTRRCVVMKLPDFTLERYEEAQRQNAAAVLILMPSNLSAVPQEVIQVSAPVLCTSVVPLPPTPIGAHRKSCDKHLASTDSNLFLFYCTTNMEFQTKIPDHHSPCQQRISQ